MVAIRNPTEGSLLRTLLASGILLTANLQKRKLSLGSQNKRHSPRCKQASKPRASLGPQHSCPFSSPKRRGYRPSQPHPKHKSQQFASEKDSDDLLLYQAQDPLSTRRCWTQILCQLPTVFLRLLPIQESRRLPACPPEK